MAPAAVCRKDGKVYCLLQAQLESGFKVTDAGAGKATID